MGSYQKMRLSHSTKASTEELAIRQKEWGWDREIRRLIQNKTKADNKGQDALT